MGLTIHYSFAADAETEAQARELVEHLQHHALQGKFDWVGEIVEFQGEEILRGQDEGDPTTRWLLIQAGNYLEVDEQYFDVPPTRVIAFSTVPGPGCEAANFGLCRFPESTVIDGQTRPTGMNAWQWSSFCKTQYAANPDCGGSENFLRCHTGVVRMLDRARELGFLQSVTDESEYWERRDSAELVRVVDEWNRRIAGFVGGLKDDYDGKIESEITRFPDFEHLEARDRTENES